MTAEQSTMMTLASFIAAHGITMQAEYADRNPNAANDKWAISATHYLCTMKRKDGRRTKQMQTYYSMGAAHTREPGADDVLNCLAMDSSGVENAGDFNEWCREYGYDTDSRKAEHTYKIVCRQAKRLRQFLGEENYKTLLWNTESL